jgi:hypothetical protein
VDISEIYRAETPELMDLTATDPEVGRQGSVKPGGRRAGAEKRQSIEFRDGPPRRLPVLLLRVRRAANGTYGLPRIGYEFEGGQW